MRTGLQSRGNIVGDAQSQIMLHQKLRDILLVWCCFAIAGCLNQPVNGPVSKAQISLNQARRIRADAKMAIGYYLDAADSALSSAKSSSSTSSADSQATYNRACQEMAVRLQANPGLWNRNATVSAEDHTYRLKFTSGSRQAGVWDSSYFDDLHTPRQLRRRFRLLPPGKNGWGGVLVGVHRPAAPRKYFLPPHGLAVPPEDGLGPWRRWLDTFLESPDDICPISNAPLVAGLTYLVNPRSVVALARIAERFRSGIGSTSVHCEA
jgi:hypothetical protein